MSIGWNDLAFLPSPELAAEIVSAWDWRFDDKDWTPFFCSRLGDVFFERTDGSIGWLSCASGLIEEAASDRSTFDSICREWAEQASLWFGPGLVEQLHGAGKVAGPSDCYQFVIPPVFAECRYEPDNFGVVPVREVFIGLSDFHKQLAAVPDGKKVQIKVID